MKKRNIQKQVLELYSQIIEFSIQDQQTQPVLCAFQRDLSVRQQTDCALQRAAK